MIVIISISYMLCVLCLDFPFLFCFILVSPTCDDVRQGRNENWFHFSQDFERVVEFPDSRMKESMIFNTVLLSKQYRRDTFY